MRIWRRLFAWWPWRGDRVSEQWIRSQVSTRVHYEGARMVGPMDKSGQIIGTWQAPRKT